MGKIKMGHTSFLMFAETTGIVDASSQACLQWEKMLSSPDTWADMALTLDPHANAYKF